MLVICAKGHRFDDAQQRTCHDCDCTEKLARPTPEDTSRSWFQAKQEGCQDKPVRGVLAMWLAEHHVADFLLTEGKHFIGTASSCSVRLPQQSAYRFGEIRDGGDIKPLATVRKQPPTGTLDDFHAVIRLTKSEITVADCLSSAGTLLNGQPLIQSRLHSGDVLSISEYQLHFISFISGG